MGMDLAAVALPQPAAELVAAILKARFQSGRPTIQHRRIAYSNTPNPFHQQRFFIVFARRVFLMFSSSYRNFKI